MKRPVTARILVFACAFAALGIAFPAQGQFTGGVVGGTSANKPAGRGFSGGVVGDPPAPAPSTTGPAAAWVPVAKSFPPVPADPIERPDYLNKPVPIKRSVTSATAMMIIEARDGSEIGMTSDVIATVVAGSRTPPSVPPTFVTKQADVGKEMETSFDEAVRAVKVRYPLWQPGHIEFSFGDKYTPHDGGSAGTCFAVMMLSEIEGFEIDNKCAVTGDITVDWKVRRIGGTPAKLKGAAADKCLYAGIPTTNSGDVVDMYLIYGFESVRDIQIFTLDTLQDATALLRTDRAPQLVEAMKEFNDLKPHMQSKGALSSPDVQKALQEILTLAPNHLSARSLLDIGQGNAPKQVSPSMALEMISTAIYPYSLIIKDGKDLTRQAVPAALTTASRKQLNSLRPYVPKELNKVLADATQIVETTEAVAAKTSNVQQLETRWNAFVTDYRALGMDKSFVEKLIRE